MATYIVIGSILSFFLCIVRPFVADNTFYIGRIYAWGILPLAGIKVEVENPEYIKTIPEKAVFISNHQNNFDVFIIGAFVTHHTVSVGKKIIKYFPFFGQIYWLSGNILIDRKRKKKALGAMNQAADQIIEKGIRVWVMPEGTRSKGNGLLPFKKGAFHLAKQSGTPMIPICMSSYHHRLNLNSLKPTLVKIKYLEQIPADIYEKKEVSQVKDEVYETFKRELKLLDTRTVAQEVQP